MKVDAHRLVAENLGKIMLAFLFLVTSAMAEKPTAAQIEQWCTDGTISPLDPRCPPTAPPVTMPPKKIEVSLPMPSRSRPARPRSNPGLWVNTNDYPSRSLQQEQEGIVGFRLTVGLHGRVEACDITASSGSDLLDAATCSNITRRARFEPALDANGNPTIGRYSNRVTWKIPSGPSYAEQIELQASGPQAVYGTYTEISEDEYPTEALRQAIRGFTHIVLTIDNSGNVTNCTVRLSSKNPLLDAKSCEIATRWKFLPARDANGQPLTGSSVHVVKWVLPDSWKQLRSIPVTAKPTEDCQKIDCGHSP